MPTKTQAKVAVSAAATAANTDIDNTLPVGVDITDGSITFAPTRYFFELNAVDSTTATSWSTTIQANLTTQARAFTIRQQLGRRGDDAGVVKEIVIVSALATYRIKNF